MIRTARAVTVAALSLAVACGGGGDSQGAAPPLPPPPFNPVVDLRADVNRDGIVDLGDDADDRDEDAWTPAAGAILLANLDDDLSLCSFSWGAESDDALAACNDAADEIVNGPDDLLDLAPLRTAPWPAAPDDAVATLTVAPPAASRVRIFRDVGGAHRVLAPGAEIGAAELRTGLKLAIEATDIARDGAAWSGLVDLTFRVQRRGAPSTAVEDRVQLRVAPVIVPHTLLPARTLFVSDLGEDATSLAFRAEMSRVRDLAGLPDAVSALATRPSRDRWMQDFFEDGYAAMPAPGGSHGMRVILRSPFLQDPTDAHAPLRFGSRIAYLLRGKDVAVAQQFSRDHDALEMRTLDSMGNTEVVPPHAHAGVEYPLGRILRGSSASFYPDPSFTRLLGAQGVQPTIEIDTSWLFVGHVDETLSFVPSTIAPRGWVALVADPPLAVAMLQQLEVAGEGGAKLFQGLVDRYGNPAERTVSQVLSDETLRAASAVATQRIAEQLDVLRAEVGLADEEIVRVPVLFAAHTPGRLAAYLTNTVNLLAPVPGLVVAPEPHGPVLNGIDPFRAQLEAALAPHGVAVTWVDAWRHFHVFVGEIHCGTNVLRELPAEPWWAL